MNKTNDYRAVKEGETYTLFINGVQSFCPKIQPIPLQGRLGKIEFSRFPCNTGCPFALIINENSLTEPQSYYHIYCEGSELEFKLSEIKEQKESAPILSMQ